MIHYARGNRYVTFYTGCTQCYNVINNRGLSVVFRRGVGRTREYTAQKTSVYGKVFLNSLWCCRTKKVQAKQERSETT